MSIDKANKMRMKLFHYIFLLFFVIKFFSLFQTSLIIIIDKCTKLDCTPYKIVNTPPPPIKSENQKRNGTAHNHLKGDKRPHRI